VPALFTRMSVGSRSTSAMTTATGSPTSRRNASAWPFSARIAAAAASIYVPLRATRVIAAPACASADAASGTCDQGPVPVEPEARQVRKGGHGAGRETGHGAAS